MISCVTLGGCATVPPLSEDEVAAAGLARIHGALQDTIAAAHADPTAHWHSGACGNVWINFWGPPNYGLCYHWQELVYEGVSPTVRRVGWAATGIAINLDSAHEHHAVLVYDPAVILPEQLLGPEGSTKAYVLDAWRRGRADIYVLHDWIDLAWEIRVQPRLEDLPAGE